MLRGINRSIIEINETESKYFEKILIFVKPEFATLTEDKLKKEANRAISKMTSEPMGLKRGTPIRKRMAARRRKRVLLVSSFLVSVIIAVILFKVF